MQIPTKHQINKQISRDHIVVHGKFFHIPWVSLLNYRGSLQHILRISILYTPLNLTKYAVFVISKCNWVHRYSLSTK